MTGSNDYSLRDELRDFLYHEAECLDTGQYDAWFALIHEDIEYRVPVRHTPEARAGSGFSKHMGHIDDNYQSLKARVARMKSPYAWAESPPSRIRHFITNIRFPRGAEDDVGVADDVIAVTSSLLIFRSNSDDAAVDLLSAGRHDKIHRGKDGQLRLFKRLVLLDQTTINTHNISFLF